MKKLWIQKLSVAMLIIGLALLGIGLVPTASSAQSSTESINVNLTVGTTSTPTDDEKDDEDDQEEQTDGGGDPRSGQSAELLVRIGEIMSTQESVEITWETTVAAQSEIRWQRADGNGQSFIQTSADYGRTHTTEITGLDPGTRYEITLTAETRSGDTKTRRETVQTELPDAPESVSGLRSNLTGDGGVQLSWNNPERFDYVRVTRRSDFFSDEPLVGELVYEGEGRRVVDADVESGQTFFYSVFTRSEDGQWSAPALTEIYVPQVSETPESDPIQDIVDNQPEAPQETQDQLTDLSFADLIFSQGKTLVDKQTDNIALTAETPFSLGVDYKKVPEVLKTIVVTITDPDEPEKTFSFLLRSGQTKDFYKATVGGLAEYGTYKTEVTVLDYKYRRVKTLTGDITIEPQPASQATSSPAIGGFSGTDESGGASEFAFVLIGLIIFGFIIIAITRLLATKKAHT